MCYIDAITPGQEIPAKKSLIIFAKIEILLEIILPYIIITLFNLYVMIRFKKILKFTVQETIICN